MTQAQQERKQEWRPTPSSLSLAWLDDYEPAVTARPRFEYPFLAVVEQIMQETDGTEA